MAPLFVGLTGKCFTEESGHGLGKCQVLIKPFVGSLGATWAFLRQ